MMFVLIGISLVFAFGFLVAFIYNVKTGQYDDDYTPSVRILFDNPEKPSSQKKHDTCK
ncbi:MAG: cbb3-type cytochrome oxidase assembly protein CcoS [Chitinophagales bacterium]|nr:cbb3-type cytochrome oxidase assembly protein CcoS [Chitinophagales bacterium]